MDTSIHGKAGEAGRKFADEGPVKSRQPAPCSHLITVVELELVNIKHERSQVLLLRKGIDRRPLVELDELSREGWRRYNVCGRLQVERVIGLLLWPHLEPHRHACKHHDRDRLPFDLARRREQQVLMRLGTRHLVGTDETHASASDMRAARGDR